MLYLRVPYYIPATFKNPESRAYTSHGITMNCQSTFESVDVTESFTPLGPVEPLVRQLLIFLSTVSKAKHSYSSQSSAITSSKTLFGKFRLWVRSFDTEECHLDKLLEEDLEIKEAVVLLLSGLVAILVEEFGYREAPFATKHS
jgi:hypothetical protein